MVDSLLNYKIQKANEVLNVVETKISIPEQLRLHSFDLNVLLGNLLDKFGSLYWQSGNAGKMRDSIVMESD